jgi:hypothetical protein
LGGIMGLFVVYSLVNESTGFAFWFFSSPFIALYIVSLCAGIFYWIKGQEWRFYFLSLLNFCAQVLQFVVAGISFKYYYGLYLAIGFNDEPNLVIRFESLTLNYLIQFGEAHITEVMIYPLPILFIIILRWMEKNVGKVDKEAEGFLQEGQEVAGQ